MRYSTREGCAVRGRERGGDGGGGGGGDQTGIKEPTYLPCRQAGKTD